MSIKLGFNILIFVTIHIGTFNCESDPPLHRDKPRTADRYIDESKANQTFWQFLTEHHAYSHFIYYLFAKYPSYVIFDCEKPSYLQQGNKLVHIKNHFLNDYAEGKRDKRIQVEPPFICNKQENVWRSNPKILKENGYMGINGIESAESRNDLRTLSDEIDAEKHIKQIIEYYNIMTGENKVFDQAKINYLVECFMTIIHHPNYYRSDSSSVVLDFDKLLTDKIPAEVVKYRKSQLDSIHKKAIEDRDNFTLPVDDETKNAYFGDGFQSIVFDCRSPKYIIQKSSKNKVVEDIKEEWLLIALKEDHECGKDQVWRKKRCLQRKKPCYTTFDFRLTEFGFSVPFEVMKIFELKGICKSMLRFLGHPGFFIKESYPLPSECSSNDMEFLFNFQDMLKQI